MEQAELIELIERGRQGDREAQDALVREAQNRVYYHCKKMLKNEEDAQDAVQDVLIVMITSLDKLRQPAAFWGWVNGITANRCRHLLSEPHKEWQIPEDEDGNSMLDSIEDFDEQYIPDKALDNEETRRMILGLVDGLSPEQRMSVLFYYYDEMSVKEIAEAMDVSEGTVKSRLNYARKAIKNGVEDYERKGVKLYSASPILLLLYFLRQDAANTTLSAASAAAIADAVAAAAESAAAGTMGASAAGTTAAGAAVKAGSAISAKLIAGIAAGAIVLGGAGVGIASVVNRSAQEPEPSPTAIVETVLPTPAPELTLEQEEEKQEQEEEKPEQEQEPEQEPEPEPEETSFPEACAAYLETLTAEQSLIEAYTDWYSYIGALRTVAFVDIMGDSTPEMIYVEAASAASSESYLTILTYQDGQAVTLVRESWDFLAGSGLGFDLYQAEGGKALYSYSSYGDTYTASEWIRFEDTGGQLTLQRLGCRKTDAAATYSWNGEEISEAEYSQKLDAVPTEAEYLVMSNVRASGNGFIGYQNVDPLAMTYEAAVEFLTGNAADS